MFIGQIKYLEAGRCSHLKYLEAGRCQIKYLEAGLSQIKYLEAGRCSHLKYLEAGLSQIKYLEAGLSLNTYYYVLTMNAYKFLFVFICVFCLHLWMDMYSIMILF